MSTTDIATPSEPGDYISTVNDAVVVRISEKGSATAVITAGDAVHESAILDLPFFASLYGPFNMPEAETDPEPTEPESAPATRRAKKADAVVEVSAAEAVAA